MYSCAELMRHYPLGLHLIGIRNLTQTCLEEVNFWRENLRVVNTKKYFKVILFHGKITYFDVTL